MKQFNLVKGILQFNNALLHIGRSFVLSVDTLVTAIGSFVILVGLITVEIQRVTAGIALFEANIGLSVAFATVLVIYLSYQKMNIVKEEHEANFTKTHYKFSLRLWLQDVKYWLGQDSLDSNDNIVEWKEKEASPAQAFINTNLLVKTGIFVLAFSGNVNHLFYEVLNLTNENVYLSILNSFINGDIRVVMPLTSSLIVTLIVIIAIDNVSARVAKESIRHLDFYNKSQKEIEIAKVVEEAPENMTEESLSNKISLVDNGTVLIYHEKDSKAGAKAFKFENIYKLIIRNEDGTVVEKKLPTLLQLQAAMREVQSDLRRWKRQEGTV